MKRMLALFLALMLIISLPAFALAEEKPVITVAVADKANVEDYNTNVMTLMLEEQLGIDIQFMSLTGTDYTSKINMMIQSGGAELPDVLFVTPTSAMMLNWIESGCIIPLTKYYNDPAFSPNIHDAIKRTGEVFTKMIVQYDGNIYTIPRFNQTYDAEYNQKIWFNAKWLEALDADAPTTPDELYDLFVKVKNTDLNGNGKADEIGIVGNMTMDTYVGWFNYIMNAYIYAGDMNYFVVNDGVVSAAYNTDAWKDGLKFMRKLFAEELIPKEILTQDNTQYLAMLNSEDCTTMSFVYNSPSRVNAAMKWRTDFQCFPPLINRDTGKPLSTYRPSTPNEGMFFITKNCKDPDTAFRLGDLMVSQYFSIMTRWGQEGVDWDFVKNLDNAEDYVGWVDGFDPLILVYDDGKFWSSGEIQNRSYMQQGPYIREYAIANGRAKDPNNISEYDRNSNAAAILYQTNAYRPDEVIPKLVYSSSEIDVIADVLTTLNEYRAEWTANALAGNIDIDAEWENYKAELEKIGLQEVIDIYQTVYDRMYK